MGSSQPELWKIFEGDLEGAGYPRNEKAWQGEVLELGYTQSLTATSVQERGKESSWCELRAPASDTREREKTEVGGSRLQNQSPPGVRSQGSSQ